MLRHGLDCSTNFMRMEKMMAGVRREMKEELNSKMEHDGKRKFKKDDRSLSKKRERTK